MSRKMSRQEKEAMKKGKKEAAAIVRRETHIKNTRTTVNLMQLNSDLKNLQLNIARVETLLRSHDLTDENRKQLEGKLEVWRGILNKTDLPPVTAEDTKKRMAIIESNPGLLEVFNAFWVTVLFYTVDDDVDVNNTGVLVNQRLDKKGYFKFNRNIYIALTDQRNLMKQNSYLETRWSIDTRHLSVDEAVATADDDGGFTVKNKKKSMYRRESDTFIAKGATTSANIVLDEGNDIRRRASEALPNTNVPLKRTTFKTTNANIKAEITDSRLAARGVKMKKEDFFNMLYNILDVWAELLDKSYYAVFAWSLLESIADTSVYPPKLKAPNEVTCTTKIENEAGMWSNYVQTGKVRHALSVQAETVDKIPGCIRRLAARKKAREILENEAQKIKVVYERMKREDKIHAIEEGEATDSDEEKLKKMDRRLREGRLRNGNVSSDDSGSDTDESVWTFDSDGNRYKRKDGKDRKDGKGRRGDRDTEGRKIYAMDMNVRDTAAMRNRRREKHNTGDQFDMKNQARKPLPAGQRKLIDKLTDTSKTKSVAEIRRFQDREGKRKVLRSSLLRRVKDMDGDILDYWKYASSAVGHQAMKSIDDIQYDSGSNMWDTSGDQVSVGGGSLAESSVGSKDTLMKLEAGLVDARVKEAEWNATFLNDHTQKRLGTIYSKYADLEKTRTLEQELAKEEQTRRKVAEAAGAYKALRARELKQQKAAYTKYKALAKERFESRKAMVREMGDRARERGANVKAATKGMGKEAPMFLRDRTALDLLLHTGDMDFSGMPVGPEDDGSLASQEMSVLLSEAPAEEPHSHLHSPAPAATTAQPQEPLSSVNATAPPSEQQQKERERVRRVAHLHAKTGKGPGEVGNSLSLMGDSIHSLDLGSGTFYVPPEGTSPSMSPMATTTAAAAAASASATATAPAQPPILTANFSTTSMDTEDQMRTLTSKVVSNSDALAARPVLEKHDSYRDSPLLPELNPALTGAMGGEERWMEDAFGAAGVLDEAVLGGHGGSAPPSRAVSAPGTRPPLSGSTQVQTQGALPTIESPLERPHTSQGTAATTTDTVGYGVVRKGYPGNQGGGMAPLDTTAHLPEASLNDISAENWFDVGMLQIETSEPAASPAASPTATGASQQWLDPASLTPYDGDRLGEMEAEDIEMAILEQARIERRMARKQERERRKAYLSADILFVRSKMRAAYKLVM